MRISEKSAYEQCRRVSPKPASPLIDNLISNSNPPFRTSIVGADRRQQDYMLTILIRDQMQTSVHPPPNNSVPLLPRTSDCLIAVPVAEPPCRRASPKHACAVFDQDISNFHPLLTSRIVGADFGEIRLRLTAGRADSVLPRASHSPARDAACAPLRRCGRVALSNKK